MQTAYESSQEKRALVLNPLQYFLNRPVQMDRRFPLARLIAYPPPSILDERPRSRLRVVSPLLSRKKGKEERKRKIVVESSVAVGLENSVAAKMTRREYEFGCKSIFYWHSITRGGFDD